ncbi:MAG: replicative DNA helicase [Candidatus Paceibacterota bacterium]
MATEMRKINIRIPPQNTESERALLGSIMLRPEALPEIMDILSPDAFYSDKHKTIFKAMTGLYEKREPIDLLTISSKLKESGDIDRIGGMSYLTEIVNSVPSSSNAEHYAEIVHKKYMARKIIEAAEHIANLGYDEENELGELLDKAEKRMYDVTSKNLSGNYVELTDVLGTAMDRLDRLHKTKDEIRGVPTGFKDLDFKLSGLQNSDLILLAARPSMGKTSLALDIARNAAIRHNVPTAIFSLEMSTQQLVDRMLAGESRVDAWKLRTGKLSLDSEFDKIRASLEPLSKAPIFIDDQAANNILKMRSVIRRLKHEKNLGLVIVDYLQLMTPVHTKGGDNMVQQITEISHSLKQLAKEFDIPVLALSQLSRAVESRGGKPRLSDLRDSGCLSGDTIIVRADTGERINMRDLVGETNVPIFSIDEEYNLIITPISKVFSNGQKEIFALKTRSGRSIRASANHPFFTMLGWKRLDKLSAGMRIGLPRSLDIATKGSSLSNEEIILLAHLLGDGCVLPRQPIHYTSADPENIEIVEKSAKSLFGISARRVKQENWWHSYLTSPYHLARGKRHPITLWYEKLGISPVRSYDKVVPEEIFKGNNEQIMLFLRHLWATDGNISWKLMKDRKPSASIYYSSSSEQLAKDVQHLLLRLGIWSTISKVLQGKYRPMYCVYIQSVPVQLKFCELVGSYGARGKIVPEIIQALKLIESNPNSDTIPKEVWQLFVGPEKENADMSWRDLAGELDISYNGSALSATGVSRQRLLRIAKVLSSEKLLHLAESGIYWDEIVSIESCGVEEVFDATVPGTHNFVAGDMIVHNSLEQDADVVIFIHRDQNDEGGGKKQTAEILIEKHRNGPTGKIDLFFDQDKSSFQSVDKDHGFGDFNKAGAF